MAKLDEAIKSWFDGEAVVRFWADHYGLLDLEKVNRLYHLLRDEDATRGAKADATRELRKMVDAAQFQMSTSGPGPSVSALEWEWGVPGSKEDRELLEASP